MKKLIQVVFLFIAFAIGFDAAAQTKTVTITGKVTSFKESLPLEGVSIVIKDDSVGTGTQADGSFTLPLVPGKKLLVVSLPGYEKLEVPITSATDYNVVLKRGSGPAFHHATLR